MRETWFLLQSGPGKAAENMALDETLLEAAPRLGRPLLRFYSWIEPAASFGYFQKYSHVAVMTELRPLVRRPTGGGLVPHAADWTYSLIFPPTHFWYALRAQQSYQRAHQWIQKSFARLALPTELAAERRFQNPGNCFAGAEKFDLLWQRQKIAGAAQRRTRSGLLIQGSVQVPPVRLAKADWQKALCDVAYFDWAVDWISFELDSELGTRAMELAEQKYSRPQYNQRGEPGLVESPRRA